VRAAGIVGGLKRAGFVVWSLGIEVREERRDAEERESKGEEYLCSA
jgi:hypothetical protein